MKKIIGIIFISSSLFGCTGTFLKTVSNGYVYARTLEFGTNLESNILFVPRNYQFIAPSPQPHTAGLTWRAKYAVVGANAFGLHGYVDGVNEKGLAGGLFYFPDFAQYQEVTLNQYSQSLPMWLLLTWILTTCETVDQVKRLLPSLYVTNVPIPGTKQTQPGHLIVHDSNGKSMVVEYVQGSLFMYDNPLGVITNSPTFDWHLTNVRNYINLSPINAAPKELSGVTFAQLGQGSGMHGLPGDYTPPSRFIRINAYTQSTLPLPTELDAVYHAFHMLNNFDIPKGSVRDEKGHTEYTQWTSACDMKNKIYYFKTYENFQLQKIDLAKMDFNTQAPKSFPMNKENLFIDITQ